MLGLMGTVEEEFLFEMNEVSYQRMKEVYTFGWSKKERLNNSPIYMKKGKSSHSIELEGLLVLKKTYALDPLLEMAEQKVPLTFVTLDFARVFRVVIMSISIDKDIFLESGAEVRKKFRMQLEEFYGN
jgi:phage protein U